MSLRAFHILFILLATLLAAGCSWWAFANQVELVVGVTSAVISAGLAIYGVYFVKKARRLIL